MDNTTAPDIHAPAPVAGAGQRLLLDVVMKPDTLARLHPGWESVYAADPEAQYFLSWTWMRGHLEQRGQGSWFVLAVRTDSEPSRYLGFLPLSLRKEIKDEAEIRYVETVGSPVADYTGALCLPEHQDAVLPSFGLCIRRLQARMRWSELRLTNLRASQERQRLLLGCFTDGAFSIMSRKSFQGDETDHDLCPSIDLPASWDEYLNSRLSANMRQKLRRLERQMQGSPEYVVRHATAETVEADLDAVLRHWGEQWAERKGSFVDPIKMQSRAMLMRSFASGSLLLPVLLRDGVVVAGLAIFVDEVKRSYLFYLAGRDKTLSWPPPGLVLHAHSIRHAISRGFRTYDFMRGNEPYKYSFGAEEQAIRTLIVGQAASALELAT
jgi:CelD/BcsL family acetyltransferase involved in cellulose biosynthesis